MNKILDGLKRFYSAIAKTFARFYNSLPKQLKVIIFSTTSTFVGTTSVLLIADMKAIADSIQDPYVVAMLVASMAIFSGFVNEIQKKLVDLGTIKLIEQNDTKTIEKIKEKIAKDQRSIV